MSLAIKAYEPSMTEKDVFIGLNSEGRLISVEAESTTLHLDSGVPHSQTIQLVPQELLPLSMFLRAIGGTVKVCLFFHSLSLLFFSLPISSHFFSFLLSLI